MVGWQLFAALIVVGLTNALLLRFIIRRVKIKHALVWKKLGQPSDNAELSMRSEYRLIKFILFLRYRTLGDAHINWAGDASLICTVAQIVLMIALWYVKYPTYVSAI